VIRRRLSLQHASNLPCPRDLRKGQRVRLTIYGTVRETRRKKDRDGVMAKVAAIEVLEAVLEA
jgi:hypothetical protein